MKGTGFVSIPFIAGQWSLQVGGRMGRQPERAVSIPFIAGQWSLHEPMAAAALRAFRFQSPSLRGSGRFAPRRMAEGQGGPRFNPLHCGAVVASISNAVGRRVTYHEFQSPSLRGSGRFLIVFLLRRVVMLSFQSPSLRGSGRFGTDSDRTLKTFRRFNPLHCGAVVASNIKRYTPSPSQHSFNPLHCGAVVASPLASLLTASNACSFQSPSLRGSGRFKRKEREALKALQVSIPFIAGQWSLRLAALRRPPRAGGSFQSPSLRGSGRFLAAVVVGASGRARFQSPSLRGSGRFARTSLRPAPTPSSFNPLHCGAVVASRGDQRRNP